MQERPFAKSILVGYIMLDDFWASHQLLEHTLPVIPCLDFFYMPTSLELSIVEVHIQSDFHLMDHHQQS